MLNLTFRYEGTLYTIDTKESTVALQHGAPHQVCFDQLYSHNCNSSAVRAFGTEGRKKDGPQIAPSSEVYEFIIFRASDIRDLHVSESPASAAPASDPEISSVCHNQPIMAYARLAASCNSHG